MSGRITGILLLTIGVMAAGGADNGSLPIAAFWLGLLFFPLGGYMLLKSNRHTSRRRTRSLQRSPAQTTRARPRKSTLELQDKRPRAAFAETAGSPMTPAVPRDEVSLGPIDFDSDPWDSDPLEPEEPDDADFKISPDMSFPAEDQEHFRTELRKLERLFEAGRIDKQEFDAARAKLLL